MYVFGSIQYLVSDNYPKKSMDTLYELVGEMPNHAERIKCIYIYHVMRIPSYNVQHIILIV